MVKKLNFLLRLSPFSLYPIPVLKKCKKPDDVLFINAAGELTRWFGRRPTTPIPCGLPAAVDLPSAISAALRFRTTPGASVRPRLSRAAPHALRCRYHSARLLSSAQHLPLHQPDRGR